MVLSIIIVNYNVKYFLEQCLHSVYKASKGIAMEVIVVDNCSTDGSEAYIKNIFPATRYYFNSINTGFAKACNLGLAKTQGEYILFLNPDTIVTEDCFVKCVDYFQRHPLAGALGVRMIDGAGQYLKESKRGFPDAATSFFKLTGLSRLFPRSSLFARYYLGHKDEYTTTEADVLSGAFLFTSKAVLQKTGGFDEAFFMYGEDIDLSFRIQQAGFRNIYYPEVTIIHFKGESTRKQSLSFITLFYKAMNIFVKKHYGATRALLFTLLIQAAILCRALLTGIFTLVNAIVSIAIDVFKKKPNIANHRFLIVTAADNILQVKKVFEKSGLSHRIEAWLTPDIRNNSIEELSSKTLSPATSIILCESEDLSFVTILSAIARIGREKIILIHGSNTQSIAGSPAKDANGITIPLS